MIQAFTKREAEMCQAAEVLAESISSGELHLIPPQPDEVDETGATAVEGRLLVRRALVRERDPRLRARKIEHVQRRGLPLQCGVCAFDFARTYGELGLGYIEVHHVTPLYVAGVRETRLEDLVCLCANCHRMCHRTRPGESWRTPATLRELMRKHAEATNH